MVFSCYAVVSDAEKRQELVNWLNHHHTLHVVDGEKVSLEMECVSYKTFEKVLTAFEATDSQERGFAVIGSRKEVDYDSG